jgi:uncharacterized membrane protein YheB (UPF0754 family)
MDKINKESTKGLEKEAIWKVIQPGRKFDDVRYRKLCSELLKLVESFLAQEHYQANPLYQATYLLEAVSRKKMDKLFNSSIKTARRLSKQQPYKPGNFYFYQYQVEKSYQELSEHEYDRASKRNYENILENLDKFYLAEKLRYYCSMLSHESVSSHKYKFLFKDAIIEHLNQKGYLETPPISIYHQICMSQLEPEEEKYFFTLKELAKESIEQFPPNEAEQIYAVASNYAIKKVNSGNSKFLQEYFEIYQELIDKELIYKDGELSPYVFRNIILSALRLGKYDWTEDFINNFSERIPEGLRENAVSFNLAQLYFKREQYEKVLELLNTVEYEDFTYNLNSKTILIMTYYEMDEIDPLDFLMESFRTYLNRHKEIPENRRKLYVNLIKFTKKLTKLIPGDKKNLKKLKEEVLNTKGIASGDWLLQKITELE